MFCRHVYAFALEVYNKKKIRCSIWSFFWLPLRVIFDCTPNKFLPCRYLSNKVDRQLHQQASLDGYAPSKTPRKVKSAYPMVRIAQ